jgi:hypothetical protein
MSTNQILGFKILGAVVLCSLVAYLSLRSNGYGEVSDKTYEIATAMYSVCNRQDTAKLTSIDQLVQRGTADSSITVEEATMLREILELAQAGDWQTATNDARRLMNDQVKYP